ncbi:hypothetical protein FKM82_028657 [Ascaphus truei]
MSRGRWAIDDRHMNRERREDLDSVSLKGGKSKRGGNRKGSVTADRGEQEPHASTPAIRARCVCVYQCVCICVCVCVCISVAFLAISW